MGNTCFIRVFPANAGRKRVQGTYLSGFDLLRVTFQVGLTPEARTDASPQFGCGSVGESCRDELEGPEAMLPQVVKVTLRKHVGLAGSCACGNGSTQRRGDRPLLIGRAEEHTSELQSRGH